MKSESEIFNLEFLIFAAAGLPTIALYRAYRQPTFAKGPSREVPLRRYAATRTPSRGLRTELARKRERRWAHQDSNLEQAGYEPAALTVELWARYSLQSAVVSRQSLDDIH